METRNDPINTKGRLALISALIAESPDSVVVVDPSYDIQIWNKAAKKLFGWDESDIVGKNIFDTLVPPESAQKTKALIPRLANDDVIHADIRWKAKDGTPIPAEVTAFAIRGMSRETVGYGLFFRDPCEIKKHRESLLLLGKMASVGQMAGGVAHEINNPLGIILGFSQVTASQLSQDDPNYQSMKTIEREALRCKKLVHDLLRFSRVPKDNSFEIVDVNMMIKECFSLIEARSKTTDVEVIQELTPTPLTVNANDNQLQQVVINLANNAIDAMPHGGQLFIGTRPSTTRQNHVDLYVKDTGEGISKEIQQRIFDPFFTTKDAGKGTGLGLSLVQEIINNHGGHIELESEMNRGTTFTISLKQANAS